MASTIHLVGIGGVGMSALAQAYLDAGHAVSGADRSLRADGSRTPVLEALAAEGVHLFPDDGSGVDADTGRLVISTAIEDTNPDLAAAHARGIPVVHRAAALSELLSGHKLVAVAGTCGKSTVTAILGHLLAECGFAPLVVNGAQVVGWDAGGTRVGSVRRGGDEWAVAEVDESDKSLTAFHPYAAIVTNASADHYSKEEMDEVFDAFVKDCPGPVVDARGETYRPQDFNSQNASLAVRMAVALGCDRAEAEKAMESFGGVERRLQKYGECVYDDYAHNPEKLRAMWLTLAERHPGGLCVVWRPHGYAPLRKMMDDLAAMFAEVIRPQDKLLLLPVYDAGGTTDRSINSDALAAKLDPSRVELVGDLNAAFDWIAAHRGKYAAFATAGARDPGLPHLAARIASL